MRGARDGSEDDLDASWAEISHIYLLTSLGRSAMTLALRANG
jgi:hypothetical protein